jgi:hypothetical protein
MNRFQFAVADTASTVAATRGTALSAQFAAQCYPEQQDKRSLFNMSATTNAAVGAEAFIEGTDQFRMALPQGVATIVEFLLIGINGFPGTTMQGGRGVATVINNAGTLTLQGFAFTAISTTVPTCPVTIDNPSQTIRFTPTPAAGTVGTTRWTLAIRCVDVSDEG